MSGGKKGETPPSPGMGLLRFFISRQAPWDNLIYDNCIIFSTEGDGFEKLSGGDFDGDLAMTAETT